MKQVLKLDLNAVHYITVESDTRKNNYTVVIRDVKTLEVLKTRDFKRLKNAFRYSTNIYNYFLKHKCKKK